MYYLKPTVMVKFIRNILHISKFLAAVAVFDSKQPGHFKLVYEGEAVIKLHVFFYLLKQKIRLHR